MSESKELMSKNRNYDHFDDRWGFKFGAASVTRMAHVEGRYHVIAVDTPHQHVQIGVSPTGRSVRVWVDGEELLAQPTLRQSL